jgi:hypothetical protein
MHPSTKLLEDIIESETKRIASSFKGPSYHAVQHILRRLDFIIPFYTESNDDAKKVAEFRTFFNHGWAPAMKEYYTDINLNVFQPYPEMHEEAIRWVDALIIHYGKLAFCKQLIAYEKAGLIKLSSPKQNEFTFIYTSSQTGIEQYDHMSMDFFRNQIIDKIIHDKERQNPSDPKRITIELRKIIQNPFDKYIQYSSTDEITEHYNKMGYYQVLRMQGYDDFDTKDKFGSIEYWRYIDLIELIVGDSLLRMDACLALIEMNNRVDPHNTLSYTHFKDKVIANFAGYLDAPKDEIEQIISCVTLTKENYDYYLEYPSTPPPLYFQVSNNLLIKSIGGAISNPFDLLNRELKRRFRRDYDIAVNNRESRFRNELYTFFPQEKIIKIQREIRLSFDGIRTDVDAVVYDTETKVLGLFQLKWQDQFAHSMVERRSRINNLFPKANEWIEKMRTWIYKSNNTPQLVLNALQIDKQWKEKAEINGVCVFVISRNQMNFTGVELDETVAWGSWHQLIESQSRFKTSNGNPIKEMFNKLKMLSPKERMKFEELPQIDDLDITLGQYRIYYKKDAAGKGI